jgi:hypothetical protein
MQDQSILATDSDSRKYIRHAFTGTVQLRDGDGFEFRAVDLSAGGVGFLSLRPLGIGSVVDVTFLDRSVVVRGVIRFEQEAHPHRWRIGIQFAQPQHELLAVANLLRMQQH